MYQANQELGPAFISVDLRHSRATVCVVSGRGWAGWEGVVGVMGMSVWDPRWSVECSCTFSSPCCLIFPKSRGALHCTSEPWSSSFPPPPPLPPPPPPPHTHTDTDKHAQLACPPEKTRPRRGVLCRSCWRPLQPLCSEPYCCLWLQHRL